MFLIHSTWQPLSQDSSSRGEHRGNRELSLITDRPWCLLSLDQTLRLYRAMPPAESRRDEEESLLTGGMEMEPATTLQRVFTPSAAVGGATCLSACWLARTRWSEVPYKEDLGGLDKTLLEVEAVQEGFSFRRVLVYLIKQLTLLLHHYWLWFLL